MLYRTSIGLDVHARSIAATAFIPETGEMVQKAFPHGAGMRGLPPRPDAREAPAPGVPAQEGDRVSRKDRMDEGPQGMARQARIRGPLRAARLRGMPREREVARAQARKARRAIEERAAGEDMAPAVSALRCVRGIPAVTAFSIAAEIGDFSRFPDARSFMSFVGLVPSEPSGGESVSRGSITRTGNIHVRTLLVEAAEQHARPLRPMSAAAMGDAAGVPADVAEAAARESCRLHSRAAHLRGRGKPASVVNAAIARELAELVWALARMAG